MSEVILVTGAAGRIGQALRTRLARPGRTLRLLDVAPLGELAPGEEAVVASIAFPGPTAAACEGVDAIVHLAGIGGEASYDLIQRVNVEGTRAVLEGAREHGVGRVLLASSSHAVGYQPRSELVPADVAFAPDTWYGWSKTAIESMGALYHYRFGMDVVALRIGACSAKPEDVRALGTWLSFDDCGRMVEAALTTPSPGFRQIWGVSANTRRWWSLAEGEALGYHPKDDSEIYADEVPDNGDFDVVGGPFTQLPLGGS